jgi:hypothetical protein
LKSFFLRPDFRVGWVLSLGRTCPDANIFVLEKVVTVLRITTEEGEECTRAGDEDKDVS